MRVTVSIEIRQDIEKLFWLSQDYPRRVEWDNYLCEAYLLDSAMRPQLGVMSFCKNHQGQALISKYISFCPPTHAAVTMMDGPWILKRFSGTWRFKFINENLTQVRFIYHFQSRLSILSWMLGPIISLIYRKDMERRLHAFKVWAEKQ